MRKKVLKVNVFDPLSAAFVHVLRDALFVASPTVAGTRIPCIRVVVVRAKPGACTALWFEIDEHFGVFHGDHNRVFHSSRHAAGHFSVPLFFPRISTTYHFDALIVLIPITFSGTLHPLQHPLVGVALFTMEPVVIIVRVASNFDRKWPFFRSFLAGLWSVQIRGRNLDLSPSQSHPYVIYIIRTAGNFRQCYKI